MRALRRGARRIRYPSRNNPHRIFYPGLQGLLAMAINSLPGAGARGCAVGPIVLRLYMVQLMLANEY